MRFSAWLLGLTLCTMGAARLHATVLPDACGDDKVKFEVTTQKADAPIPAPAEGMAQVVLIEDSPQSAMFKPTLRYGMDGQWVGANRVNSYFILSVPPGEHHFCVSWQSSLKAAKRLVGMASMVAEAGKVYYFVAKIVEGTNAPGGGFNGGPSNQGAGGGTSGQFLFGQASEDEGKYRVKISDVSTSTAKK